MNLSRRAAIAAIPFSVGVGIVGQGTGWANTNEINITGQGCTSISYAGDTYNSESPGTTTVTDTLTGYDVSSSFAGTNPVPGSSVQSTFSGTITIDAGKLGPNGETDTITATTNWDNGDSETNSQIVTIPGSCYTAPTTTVAPTTVAPTTTVAPSTPTTAGPTPTIVDGGRPVVTPESLATVSPTTVPAGSPALQQATAAPIVGGTTATTPAVQPATPGQLVMAQASGLAFTGSNTVRDIGVGVALISAGIWLVAKARRKKPKSDPGDDAILSWKQR